MSNEFSYKGYSGSCEASIEDGCLNGRVLFIDDLIVYEGSTLPKLKTSFEAAVNRYIKYCTSTGKPASKPYSGNFNVRVSNEVHKASAQYAQRDGISLNQFVGRALENEVNKTKQDEIVRHEVTVNHVFTHQHETVDLPFSVKEPSWQQSQKTPLPKIVAKHH